MISVGIVKWTVFAQLKLMTSAQDLMNLLINTA